MPTAVTLACRTEAMSGQGDARALCVRDSSATGPDQSFRGLVLVRGLSQALAGQDGQSRLRAQSQTPSSMSRPPVWAEVLQKRILWRRLLTACLARAARVGMGLACLPLFARVAVPLWKVEGLMRMASQHFKARTLQRRFHSMSLFYSVWRIENPVKQRIPPSRQPFLRFHCPPPSIIRSRDRYSYTTMTPTDDPARDPKQALEGCDFSTLPLSKTSLTKIKQSAIYQHLGFSKGLPNEKPDAAALRRGRYRQKLDKVVSSLYQTLPNDRRHLSFLRATQQAVLPKILRYDWVDFQLPEAKQILDKLGSELEVMLGSLGEKIWRQGRDHCFLVWPDSMLNISSKGLCWENAKHREVIIECLIMLVLHKAYRNIQFHKNGVKEGVSANFRLDEGLSSHSTPQERSSGTSPAGGNPDRSSSGKSNIRLKLGNTKPSNENATSSSSTTTHRDDGSEMPKKRQIDCVDLTRSDGEEGTPSKRPCEATSSSCHDSSGGPWCRARSESMENITVRAHCSSPAPDTGLRAATTQPVPRPDSDINQASSPLDDSENPASVSFTAVNSRGFTAINAPSPTKKSLGDSVQEPSQPPSHRQSPKLHHVLHPSPQPRTQHGQLPSHLHTQLQQQASTQPPSPSSASAHHFGQSRASHPRSKSSTPHAQAAPDKPLTALNSQPAPAPAPAPSVQTASAYGIQLVSAPEAPPTAIARQAVPTDHLRLLQYDVTVGLSTLFFPLSTMPPDEAALLQRLCALWFHGKSLFRSELAGHYDSVSKILTDWLNERRTVVSLRHSMPASPSASHMATVERLLAMNYLRSMRIKWKNMSPIDGLSPDDLLCMAFEVMTNTKGSAYLFKDGLARLELSYSEFFRKEDGKIVIQRLEASAV